MEQILAEPSEISNNTDKITLLQKLAENPESRSSITDFVRQNAVELISKLSTRAIVAFISSLSNYVGTPAELDKVS